MKNSKWDNALQACEEINQLIADAPPWPDDEKLRRIRYLVGQIQGTGDSYITAKADKLSQQAAIYLSQRKHEEHRDGAMGVKREIQLSLLRAIRDEITLKSKSS